MTEINLVNSDWTWMNYDGIQFVASSGECIAYSISI